MCIRDRTYTEWDQIVLPARTVTDSYSRHTHNPGLLLDYARFSSDSLIGYARMECDTLRACTDVPVVHNIVSEYCDNYKLAEMLDYAGYDAYPRSEWDCNSMAKIGFYYEPVSYTHLVYEYFLPAVERTEAGRKSLENSAESR